MNIPYGGRERERKKENSFEERKVLEKNATSGSKLFFF